MELDKISAILMLLKQHPEVKTFKLGELHLDLSGGTEIKVDETVQIPIETTMPPDSQMLYASTDYFDEIAGEQHGG